MYFTLNRSVNLYPDDKLYRKIIQHCFLWQSKNPRNGFILGLEMLREVKNLMKDEVNILSCARNGLTKNMMLKDRKKYWLMRSMRDIGDLYRNSTLGWP
jgi:hypothetical protein